jgi:monofunctional glycosyltransferase
MLKKILRFLLKVCLWFFVSTIAVTIIYRFVPPPITPLMVIRLFEQASDKNRDMRLSKDWVSIEEISASMPKAVITSEDQNFMEHFGLDFKAIEKAQKYNDRHKGKRIKGASTISQQTAKNVFLWPNRSYLRKGLEVYFTFLIELIWSKERIMEVYLNVIEMGDGIYGVEAASQKYFHKSAAKLNKNEAALIAACLPNPLRWSPAKPTAYIQRKQQWILRNMRKIPPPNF